MMYNFINNFTLSVTQKKDNKQEEASLIFSTPFPSKRTSVLLDANNNMSKIYRNYGKGPDKGGGRCSRWMRIRGTPGRKDGV